MTVKAQIEAHLDRMGRPPPPNRKVAISPPTRRGLTQISDKLTDPATGLPALVTAVGGVGTTISSNTTGLQQAIQNTNAGISGVINAINGTSYVVGRAASATTDTLEATRRAIESCCRCEDCEKWLASAFEFFSRKEVLESDPDTFHLIAQAHWSQLPKRCEHHWDEFAKLLDGLPSKEAKVRAGLLEDYRRRSSHPPEAKSNRTEGNPSEPLSAVEELNAHVEFLKRKMAADTRAPETSLNYGSFLQQQIAGEQGRVPDASYDSKPEGLNEDFDDEESEVLPAGRIIQVETTLDQAPLDQALENAVRGSESKASPSASEFVPADATQVKPAALEPNSWEPEISGGNAPEVRTLLETPLNDGGPKASSPQKSGRHPHKSTRK